MSSESKKMKPKTNFDLILNYSNQYNWEKSKNDLGAGANADSRAGKTFSATDPLSEIVWSPDKGFNLKCVDSSFTDKSTSLFRDVEPSNMVLALLQTVTSHGSSTKDKPIDDVFVEPLAVLCTKGDVSSTDTPARNPTSDSVVISPECKLYEVHDTGTGDNMEKMDTASGTLDVPNDQKEKLMKCWEKNICSQANIETTKTSEIMENKSSTISGQVDQCPVDDLLLQEDESKLSMEHNPLPKKHWKEGMDTGVRNQMVEIENDLYTRVEHMMEDNCTGPLGTDVSPSGISHSNKLEFIAENDLQAFNCEIEATCAAKSGFLVSKLNEDKNKSHVNEIILPCNNDLPVMHSPCSGRFHMTRSGREQKSLSDGDSSFRLPKDEQHDNPLGCESYHNIQLFSASRKRCKQEEQDVITGSKKVKKQILETSYSKSYVKQDSSFMNLVSNMMKGYSQVSHDEPGKEVHGIDAIPRTFCAENSRRYLQSSKFEVSKRGHDVGPSLHPQIRPVNPFTFNVEETREQSADIQLLSEAKTQQSCCLKDEKGNNDHTSKYKFKHVTHFPRLRDSVPMVSMFARRLGAIKQWQQTE